MSELSATIVMLCSLCFLMYWMISGGILYSNVYHRTENPYGLKGIRGYKCIIAIIMYGPIQWIGCILLLFEAVHSVQGRIMGWLKNDTL